MNGGDLIDGRDELFITQCPSDQVEILEAKHDLTRSDGIKLKVSSFRHSNAAGTAFENEKDA